MPDSKKLDGCDESDLGLMPGCSTLQLLCVDVGLGSGVSQTWAPSELEALAVYQLLPVEARP